MIYYITLRRVREECTVFNGACFNRVCYKKEAAGCL